MGTSAVTGLLHRLGQPREVRKGGSDLGGARREINGGLQHAVLALQDALNPVYAGSTRHPLDVEEDVLFDCG
jgi:hypothetical protein